MAHLSNVDIPLANIQQTMENHNLKGNFNQLVYCTWSFSTATLNYQRVKEMILQKHEQWILGLSFGGCLIRG